MQKFGFKKTGIIVLVICSVLGVAYGQNKPKEQKPTVVYNQVEKEWPVAARTNLYCAGYIQKASVNTDYRIVGADNEREQNTFSEGNFVYISRGASNGVKVGDMFSVVRPAGQFSSKLSKKGNLGIYIKEVGALEVVRVKDEVSVARVKTSCDEFRMGDLLMPTPERKSPMFEKRAALDPFGEPSGKASGRIVMAKDNRELIGREMIVYIDLGSEDSVQVGEYLTIYRPLGKGGVLNSSQPETAAAKESGYESDAYKGGQFSIQTARKSGSEANGQVVTTRKAKEGRPSGLRKVVGEMVILNVREKTATALVTRAVHEIHTGDMVEVQ